MQKEGKESLKGMKQSMISNDKKIRWMAAGFAVLAAVSMTGCSPDKTDDAAGSQASTESSGGWETATTEVPASETATDADTEESALPDNLEEGEEVLQRDNAGDVSFHGTLPDITPDWKDGELFLLVIPDADSSSAALECPVYDTQDAAGTDGAAWLDEGNSADLTDPNTVIHGTLGESSAFSGIQDYGDSSFFTSNPYLYLYGRDSISEFQVFAAYPKAHEDILTSINGFDRDEFNQYINDIYNQRSMQAVRDEELEQQVLDTWSVLTLQAEGTDGNDFIVQAVPTGVVQQ